MTSSDDQSLADKILNLLPGHFLQAQVQHRLDLISNGKWPIRPGSKILELGCGQGDCTAVLAELVGDSGHIDAVDPGALDYGGPLTLGQAHSVLSSTRIGSRITWIQASPLDYLKANPGKRWDVVVLAHCIWYFSSPELIKETFQAMTTCTDHVCIAEWSLSSSSPSGNTHLLAALAQAALECRKTETTSNIRTVISPAGIKVLAEEAGLVMQSQVCCPAPEMQDGRWEVHAVAVDPTFVEEVKEFIKDPRERGLVLGMKDAVVASLEQVGGIKEVRSMDVWSAVFATSK